MQSLIKLAGKKLFADLFQGNLLLLILRWLMLLLSLVNAVGLVMILNMVKEEITLGPVFYASFNLGICFLLIMKDFVPSFQKVVLFESGFLPLRSIHKIILWLIGNELSLFNLAILLNLLIVLISPYFQFHHCIGAILSMFIAIQSSFLLRFQLDHRFPQKALIGMVSVLIFGFYIWLNWMCFRHNLGFTWYLLGLFSIVLLYGLPMFYLFSLQPKEYQSLEQYEYKALSKTWSSSAIPSKLINAMFFGMGFKTLLLLFNFIQLYKEQTYLFNSELLFALVFAPTTLFTYGFNNYHAFSPNLFYNIQLRTGATRPFLGLYFKSVLLFCFFDFLITLGLLLFFRHLIPWRELVSFYFMGLSFLVLMGLFGSLLMPVKIEKKNFMSNLKMFTHPIVSVFSLIGVLLAYFFRNQVLINLAVLVLLVTGLAYYLRWNLAAIKLHLLSIITSK